jgi:hypothetical protein
MQPVDYPAAAVAQNLMQLFVKDLSLGLIIRYFGTMVPKYRMRSACLVFQPQRLAVEKQGSQFHQNNCLWFISTIPGR